MDSRQCLHALRGRLRSRIAKRADSEHEQAAIRVIIGTILVLYYAFAAFDGDARNQTPHLGVAALLLALTVLLLSHISFYPGVSPARRMLGIVLDVTAITYFFVSSDDAAVPLYGLYLWVIFGNGFRFGQNYLYFALALSLIGFGGAIVVLPQWASHREFALGLWGGMLAVSLYVGQLTKRLITALANAEAANMAKRRFVSSVSHELRTPLNAIIGTADLLSTTRIDGEQQEMLSTLQEASRLMLALIEDVLDFSKIEAGKQALERLEFEPKELVQCAVEVLRFQALAKGLALTVDFGPGIPATVRGDPRHLRQVLVNLLSNAVKFTPAGWVSCRVNCVGCEDGKVMIRFEVADSGIGIPEHRQSCIFDSFTQADESTTRQYGGTGLGTAIAKQLVELMGGQIGFSSELAKGSVFWFTIPLEQVADGAERRVHSVVGPASTGPAQIQVAARPLNVLIAEDNPTNSRVIQQILARAGHRYATAVDGEKALDRMLAERFDVVLLDMNMPALSGVEVAKAYRFMTSEQERARTILFSADASRETRNECVEAGIDAYLPKPVQVGPFLALLESLGASRETPRSPGQSTAASLSSAEVQDVDETVLADLRSLGTEPGFLPALVMGYLEDSRVLLSKLDNALLERRFSDCRDVLHAMKGSAVSIGAARMRAFCERVEAMPPEELFASRELVMRECELVFAALSKKLESNVRVFHTQNTGVQ